MGNGFRCGKAAGDDILLPGCFNNRRLNVLLVAGPAGVSVVTVFLHNQADRLNLEPFDHFHTDFRHGISALGTHQFLTLQTVFYHLSGHAFRDVVQGIFMLFVARMSSHSGNFFLLGLGKYLYFIEQETELLCEGFVTLF